MWTQGTHTFGSRARRLMTGGALCLAALAAAAAHPTPPTAESDKAFRSDVVQALWWADFPALVELQRQAMAADAVDASGARSRLRHFMLGINDLSKDSRSTIPVLRLLVRHLAQQEAAEPGEPLWPALQALMLVEIGWKVRGSGTANTVPPHAWEEFHGLLRQAMEHVASRGDRALSSPLAYEALLQAGRGLGLPRPRIVALLDDGLQRHPRADFLIVAALQDHLPKWGGDAREVDRFIQRYAARMAFASEDEGYALLYSRAAEGEYSHTLFQDSNAQWERMRKGYRSLLARQGEPATRQRAAYLACIARDREAFLEFASPGLEPLLSGEWGDNPQVTHDGCRRWAERL